MSQPLYWPGKYYFYAIGNTPTISFTRDISPQTPGNILLLGCGDPRNVLFTVYNEEPGSDRRLDITCSDIDPGIIARNTLLFTMILDKYIPASTMWCIFFDMKIDPDTYSTMTAHCRKLCQCSSSQKVWADSPYGSFIKFSSSHTLEEIRRHWQLYLDMEGLPPNRQQFIRDAFSKYNQDAASKFGPKGGILSPARAAGPLMYKAGAVYSEHMKHYSVTGVSSTDSKTLTAATLVNPTFAYSFVGEGCNVHYGTSPLTPFHSAALFGNATRSLRMNDVVASAQKQFGEWCDAYRARVISKPSTTTLRFLLAEATAACHAFRILNASQSVHTGIPISQWKATLLTFDPVQYLPVSGDAPKVFNVIDTSNLSDHVGLLNILVSTLPLRVNDGVIYTESLLYKGEDATKELMERLFADLGMMGLLLGVVPVDYLSGFFSRSNTHEILLHSISASSQFHQVTTWKSPTSSDVPYTRPPIVFDTMQLGTFLWDMYHCMFEDEDSMTYWRKHGRNLNAVMNSALINYNRESFVLFLKLVRSRLALSSEEWESTMDRFFNLQEADTTMPMDTVNRHDFHSTLYRHNVYTVPPYRITLPRRGRFSEWPTVPQLVRIVFSVPHSVLEDIFSGDNIGTPILQCDVRGSWCLNVFSAVHASFGRVSKAGTRASPKIAFEEDKQGWKGRSPLVVSFVMPAQLLLMIEPQENLMVNFSIRGTGPAGLMFTRKLGIALNVFSVKFLDENKVFVLPEPSLSPPPPPSVSATPSTPNSRTPEIGPCGPVVIQLDDECEQATWVVARISVQNPDVVQSFGSLGAIPGVVQRSPCVIRVTVSGISQDVVFPYPVRGNDHRLRLARKSLYIELLAPPSGPPFQSGTSGGMRVRPFPLTSSRSSEIQTWNIHYINLSRLPTLDCARPKELYKWLNPHVGSMLSARERSLRKKEQNDTLMFVKETIHAIMVRGSGIQGGKPSRVFALMDKATKNSDTVLFVDAFRYDQSAHTVVCDAFVLPLTHTLLEKHNGPFSKLLQNQKSPVEYVNLMEGEVKQWKHLLPAFSERCRTSWTHRGGACEYEIQDRVPLSEEIEHNPLCSCGQGKDVEPMTKVLTWRPFAPYVTRIALSPLFAVTYLEPIMRDINSRRCWLCRGKGKPKLKECSKCQKVRYCGTECQTKDWPMHKKKCGKGT